MFNRTCKPAYDALVSYDFRNILDGFKLAGARNRKPGFYHINAQTQKLACDDDFFLRIHARAR